MGFVCDSAGRAVLFLLLVRMGWRQRRGTDSGSWGCAQSTAPIPVAASRQQDLALHSCSCNRSITEWNLSVPVTLKLCCCTTAYAEHLTLP